MSVVLIFATAASVVAQELVVAAGETHSYFVDDHQGSEYLWYVYNDAGFTDEANSSEVQFPSGNSGSSVLINWKKSGIYYVAVTETDFSGCNNLKAKVIKVIPNNRSVGFAFSAGDSCFNSSGNGFTLSLDIFNNNGLPLEENYFPIQLKFEVNGEIHADTLNSENREIYINDQWFIVSSEQLSKITVELISAIDKNGIPIEVDPVSYTHSVYPVPEIILTVDESDTIPLNTFYSFSATEKPGYSYFWWFEDAFGNRTDFASKNSFTEEYFWNTEGEFTLFVQATSENGCLSEIISKPFVVAERENFVPSLVALPDINVGYENSMISGNVGTNDFDFMEQNRKLVYNVVGEPIPGLTFFDDGNYEYQPPAGFTGKVHFAYNVCFEQLTGGCARADVEIRVLPNYSTGNIAPIASTDAALTLPSRTVFSNLLVNDIDPDGFGALLTVATEPISGPANGIVSIQNDGSYAYTPNPGYIGIDRFLYRICDNGQPTKCDSAWVYIIVSEFGQSGQKPISASDDMFLYAAGAEYSLRQNDYDILGENLVYNTTPVVDATHGELQIYPDGTFTYIADDGFRGIDWFIYSVCNTDANPVCRQGTGFIMVTQGMQFAALAGRDTTIGSCQPFTLHAREPGDGFSYAWEPAELLDNPNSAAPVFTPGNSTLFRLTVTNEFGFEAKDSVQVNVSKATAEAGDEVFMYPNTQAVLDGTMSSGIGLQYQWTTQNGKIESGTNTATPVVSNVGMYYLEVTDEFGCTAFDSVNVGILTYAPVARDDYDTTAYETSVKINVLDNDIDPENDINPNSLSVKIPPMHGTASVDYTDFSISYKPENDFSGTDDFEYQICDTAQNCSSASVYVLVSEFRFFIPDAFSPNDDGVNDFFEIVGIEAYEENSIEIFNRWGNRVYRAENYGINTSPKFWDGKSNTGIRLGNDELPAGTYFYVLNLSNGEKRIVGSVYLDR